METKNKEVSLLFSGGWDSTLAAFKLAETFKKVHLLTFYFSNSDFVERSEVNANKLKDGFGREKIIHSIIDFDPLREKLFHGTWKQDLKKYGLFLINCECVACRIAMFARTIIYNLENSIPYCASGETQVVPPSLVPGLIDEHLKFKDKLCSDYGITHLTPVYYEKNPHYRLFELGFIDKKVEHRKFPYEYLFHKAQPTCYVGPMSVIFNMFYYIPYRGGKAFKDKSIEYFIEKTNDAREQIKCYFEERKVDVNVLVEACKSIHSKSRLTQHIGNGGRMSNSSIFGNGEIKS